MVERSFHLAVGEEAELERGVPVWLGLRYNRTTVVYAGMPGDSVYSLAVTYTSGYNSLAYNLYLPVGQTALQLRKGGLEAIKATRDSVSFAYVKD